MPNKQEREYRNMVIRALDTQEEDAKIVTGYASTFGERYTLIAGDGWRYDEIVEAEAFDDTDMSDVIMQYNHEGRVFARTRNKTLEVNPDEKGLYIKADLGGTEIGRELYDEIAGGYTDRMSFGFTVSKEYEESEKTPEGLRIYTRHITGIDKLYDVSAVSIPANDGTSIEADAAARSIRNLTDGVIERMRAERLEEETLETERLRSITNAKIIGGLI